ncbi:unnamed protein product, partial [Heterosigma akashiwo]
WPSWAWATGRRSSPATSSTANFSEPERQMEKFGESKEWHCLMMRVLGLFVTGLQYFTDAHGNLKQLYRLLSNYILG